MAGPGREGMMHDLSSKQIDVQARFENAVQIEMRPLSRSSHVSCRIGQSSRRKGWKVFARAGA
jgi:hypothetical protein